MPVFHFLSLKCVGKEPVEGNGCFATAFHDWAPDKW